MASPRKTPLPPIAVNPDAPGETLLTAGQAAAYLAVSKDFLHVWRQRDVGLPYIKLPTRDGKNPDRYTIRYKLSDIIAFIEDRIHRTKRYPYFRRTTKDFVGPVLESAALAREADRRDLKAARMRRLRAKAKVKHLVALGAQDPATGEEVSTSVSPCESLP